MKHTQEQLNEIIKQHNLWLREEGGEFANLSGADLSNVKLNNADLRCVDLSNAKLRGAKLRGVKLSFAKLNNADLSFADLSDADLSEVTGNLKHIKSIQLEAYSVVYTSDVLQVGCENHSIEDWWGFTDREILAMDGKTALTFWRKYKDHIKATIGLSPAEPTGAK